MTFTYVYIYVFFVLFLCYHYIVLFHFIWFHLINLLHSGCVNKDKPEKKSKRLLLDQTKSEQGIREQTKTHVQNAKCISNTIQSKTCSARYILY